MNKLLIIFSFIHSNEAFPHRDWKSLPKRSKTHYFISILTIFDHKKRHKNKLFKNLIQCQLFN